MRLIDADALRELLDGGYDIDLDELPETKTELLRMIDYQETVDAEPVVRCKDCVNAQYDFMVRRITGDGETLKVYWCDGREVLGDDFCSKGVRREIP